MPHIQVVQYILINTTILVMGNLILKYSYLFIDNVTKSAGLAQELLLY